MLPSARATAPYPQLPNYNIGLTQSFPNSLGGQYPVTVARHHIIPYNVLVNFWNAMLSRSHMAGGRVGGYATGFLAAMANSMLNYENNLTAADRNSLWLLLNGIWTGFIVHDPAGRPVPHIDNLAAVYEWLPGNLFIGPDGTWRSDDPGDRFEEEAGNIVGRRFATWINAYDKIQEYLNDRVSNPVMALSSLSTIARRKKVFALNPRTWNFNTRTQKFALITPIPPRLELLSRPQETVAAE